jgi:hypothetical protein
MQDWGALLNEPGRGPERITVRRLKARPVAAIEVPPTPLPGLLDTRLVRAELSRLRMRAGRDGASSGVGRPSGQVSR